MTSQTVSIKNVELFAQFAQAFNKVCADASMSTKTKLALLKLRKSMMAQALVVENYKQELASKGDNLIDEDRVAFQEFMLETVDYQFDKLDVNVIAKDLSILEIEALEPILK